MIKNPYSGKFITLEGIDGSGKSEQFKMIREELLNTTGLDVVFTKEPPNNSIGLEIYDIIRGYHPTIKAEDLSDLDMQRKYFLARRMQYQDLNLPVLRAGVHVISDRGVVSLVYGLKDIRELTQFLDIQKAMFDYCRVSFIAPDLNLIYDVDVDTAIKRLEEKERKRDVFEQRLVLERVRVNYLAIAEQIPNCVVVDGLAPIEEVFKSTRQHVFKLLGLR